MPGVNPVHIELTDFKTKEKVDELEVDAVMVATGRAPYTQVSKLSTLQCCPRIERPEFEGRMFE